VTVLFLAASCIRFALAKSAPCAAHIATLTIKKSALIGAELLVYV
jgi:hypothetical protein